MSSWRTPTSLMIGVRVAAFSAQGEKRSQFSGRSCCAKSSGTPFSPNGMVLSSQAPTTMPRTSGFQ